MTSPIGLCPRICLVTAFAAESRPVRKHLKLRREDFPCLPFPVYRSGAYLLVETGLGKLSAAATVAGVLASVASIRSVLNIGVAGADAPLGSAWLAHAVSDRASGKIWYPDLPPQRIAAIENHAQVETVDIPNAAYRTDRIFDMEAAGIFAAAVPMIGTAGVQSLKIISDNPDKPVHAFDKSAVSQIIEAQVPAITALVEYLCAREEPAREHRQRVASAAQELEEAVGRHSTSERHRLQSLLSRHLALTTTLPDLETLGAPTSAKALALQLQTIVNGRTDKEEAH